MLNFGLLSLCLTFLSDIEDVGGLPYPSKATVTSKTYFDGEGGFDFIDVSGNLKSILSNYTFEVIVSGLGFGEGPKWIQDCSYTNNGYMLIADQYSDCIWRYYTMSNGQANVECIFQFPRGSQPNAVGWNLNFPDEIYVALQAGNGIARLNLTTLTQLNYWNQSIEGYILWQCNDVIMDSQGNAYFTTYPFSIDTTQHHVVTGAWTIPRATMKPELIEEFPYGTNGIGMTLDETLLLYSNAMDYPGQTFNAGDPNQANWTNLYWRGYHNSGSFYTENKFTANNGFYYLWLKNLNSKYYDASCVSDGSAFDFDNNYWQALPISTAYVKGHIIITQYNNPTNIIGAINFTRAGYGPTNVAKGMDGYMYITITQYGGNCQGGQLGYGCGGVLGRVPLVHYYTPDGSNQYVLNCA